MLVERLQTPALIIDNKIFRQNMRAMKDLLEGTDLALRPHFKSHKCAAIARLQVQNGAKGMTCAKLSEALDLADAGIEDILIANQVVQPQKIAQLAHLANDCRLTVCVDNEQNIDAIDAAAKLADSIVHCLIEYDIGMERCGVTEPERVAALAEYISTRSNLRFEGIQAYAGHISHVCSIQERSQMTEANSKKLRELLAMLDAKGIKVNTLSGGSTGTSQIKAREGLYTELQAGSYLFMDSTYRDLDLPFKNSLFVLTTVVSTRPGLTVVDAGVKTCGVDQGMPAVVNGTPENIVASEEHFQLHGLDVEYNTGDKLLLIPGHCCSTMNLHDKVYLVEDGKVIDRIAITGRGMGK